MNRAVSIVWRIASATVLGAAALLFILFGAFALSQSHRSFEYILAALIVLCGVALIPVLGLLVSFVNAKTSGRFTKPINIVRIAVVVVRVQILLVLLVLAAIKWSTFVDLFGDMLGHLNPLPVSESVYKDLEEMIDQDDGATAWGRVQDMGNYRFRVNLPRLAARNLLHTRRLAGLRADAGDTTDASSVLGAAFDQFDLDDQIAAIDSGRYDQSKLAKYLSVKQLADAALDYSRFASASGYNSDASTVVLDVVKKLDPNNPTLLLLEANARWSQGLMKEARESFRRYVKAVAGRAPVPQRAREVAESPEEFGPEALSLMYKWWLEDHVGTYFFSSEACLGSRTIRLNTHDVGCLRFGLPEIFSASRSPDLYGWVFVGGDQADGESGFTGLSVLDLYQPDPDESRPFRFINPRIVEWARANLIPSPDAEIGAYTAQELYNGIFRTSVRHMASVFLYLSKVRDFETEVDEFRVAMDMEEFYGPSYYNDRYGRIATCEWDALRYEFATTAGWWIRRGFEGSANAFWGGLTRILQQYDSEWYESVGNEIESHLCAGDGASGGSEAEGDPEYSEEGGE